MCNGFSRGGGFAAPFATVYLVESGRTHTAEALLGSLCTIAGLCAFLLPYETRGRDLQSSELQREETGGHGSGNSGGSSGREHGLQRHSLDGLSGGAAGDGAVHIHMQHTTDGEAEMVPPHEHHYSSEHGEEGEHGPLLPPQPSPFTGQ